MEGLRTPGAPDCERERPFAVRWEDRERPIRVSTVATGSTRLGMSSTPGASGWERERPFSVL